MRNQDLAGQCFGLLFLADLRMLLMIKCFVCYIEFVGINKKDDEVHLEKNG
jgi:hypothetical protein